MNTREFNNWLDAQYGEINICGRTFDASEVLEAVDPVLYAEAYEQVLGTGTIDTDEDF